MTKTYEVHRHAHDIDDEDHVVELDQEEIPNLSRWRKFFVPRYPHHGEIEEDAINDLTVLKKDPPDEESRNRFYSADVTVLTNLSSPPATPDGSDGLEVEIRPYRSVTSDLETPSIKNDIPAIDETIEDNDSAEEQGHTLFIPDESTSTIGC
jgi:hypothetical protein